MLFVWAFDETDAITHVGRDIQTSFSFTREYQ